MSKQEILAPPVAKIVEERSVIHGDLRLDPYAWLKNRESPEVISHLEAENAYTQAVMRATEGLQESLYKELLGRIQETDMSVPSRRDDYFYYSRTEEGKQYPIFCRKHGSLDADEQVLLDLNVLAEGFGQFRLGASVVSPDHRLLAYSTDTTGSEKHALVFKHLDSGELLGEVIPDTHYSVVWANDNKTIFYSTCDEAQRPFRLHRHVIGGDPGDDDVVYEEPDTAFYLSAFKTRTRKYIVLSVGSLVTDELHYLDADDPLGEFSVIRPREQGIEYGLEHQGERFLIWTNDSAKNFKVVEAPCDSPSEDNWKEVIPHRPDVKVEGIAAFAGHFIVVQRERGLTNLRIEGLDGGEVHQVDFPEPVYLAYLGDNPEYDSTVVRFHYQSLVTPDSVFDYDMSTRDRVLLKQQEVLGGYDPSAYTSERIFAKAPDGVQVPMSLLYKKGFPQDGSRPLWLYAYGSYGASIDPFFSSFRLTLLDRGLAFAIAHIRGGGDLGEEWRDDGKLFRKMNTFTDFIACSEHLIAQGYTSKDRLVINGASAGGLLMGAVTNMRPDLFEVVVAEVPFVDVINTILDPSLLYSVLEYEEWGNPNEEEPYFYIKQYSPYDNVEAKGYPQILAISGLNDPRVNFWEPTKWVAKLRALKTDSNRLLLKTKMEAGHGGASGRYDRLHDEAFKYAFVIDALGITG